MIGAGDVHLADLGDEVRRRVLVISNDRFHRRSDRVLVVPALVLDEAEELDPWRIAIDEEVYAVDLITGLPSSRILARVGRLTSTQHRTVRRALHAIT